MTPKLPRTPKNLDPIPGLRMQDEQVIGMILALTSEITVLRARLDACEELLIAGKILVPGAIDAFNPDETAQAQRGQLRAKTISKILRPMLEVAEQELATIAQDRIPEKQT